MRPVLLQPFLCSLRNRFLPPGRFPWRAALAAAVSLGLCLLLYLVAVKVVGYFHSQNELGIILSIKIFQMAWITVFAMLVFSCMVSAVSTLFLSADNEILFAGPAPLADLFFMRTCTTGLYTSWMMVLFSLPIFAAYGTVFQAGLFYWPLLLLSIVSTAGIATGFGMAATILLVNLFPARRTKDIILYLSVCFGIFIYFMFRLMRPEELVNPDNYLDFVDYLSAISGPAAPYVPAAWAANLLSLYLLDRELDPLLVGLLTVSPFTIYFLGEWAMERFFFSGFSKSQESFGGHRLFGSRRRYRPATWRWIFAKELKLFLRDSAEWSQLFMIAALVVVYLYNFKVLPVQQSAFQEEYVTNLISFLNIGLTGFVVASLAARFVYPAVGAEGGAFFILRTAPLSLGRYLFYKYLFYALPFTALAAVLLAVSNHLLHVEGPMWWISVGSGLVITWMVVALALGFGAVHADFKAENRAASLGSMGAVLFLFTAIGLELLIVFAGGMPVYRVTRRYIRHGELAGGDLATLLLWGAGTVLVGAAVSLFMLRRGAKRLAEAL